MDERLGNWRFKKQEELRHALVATCSALAFTYQNFETTFSFHTHTRLHSVGQQSFAVCVCVPRARRRRPDAGIASATATTCVRLERRREQVPVFGQSLSRAGHLLAWLARNLPKGAGASSGARRRTSPSLGEKPVMVSRVCPIVGSPSWLVILPTLLTIVG